MQFRGALAGSADQVDNPAPWCMFQDVLRIVGHISEHCPEIHPGRLGAQAGVWTSPHGWDVRGFLFSNLCTSPRQSLCRTTSTQQHRRHSGRQGLQVLLVIQIVFWTMARTCGQVSP